MQNPYHTYLLQRLETMTPHERRIADEETARWVCALFRRRRRERPRSQGPVAPDRVVPAQVAAARETVSTR